MTLINLYRVTNSLLNLLALNVSLILNEERNEMFPIPRSDLTVTARAPEQVGSVENTLSLFLYHIAEDPYYKNMLGSGSDVPNVAKTPMALSLFYILTTHHEVDPEFDAQTQQNLMGYALKTFHDFPVITDRTTIADPVTAIDIPVLDEGLQGNGNTLQAILRPVSAEEAIAFWSSEDTRTARLSAYYEVRVVLLEPEPPQTMPGIVLNLGTYLVQLGSPHLERSQSLVHFQLPQQNRGPRPPAPLEASPARVTLDTSPEPPEGHNRLQLLGTNLTAGKSRSLVLKNNIWTNLQLSDSEETIQVKQAIVDLEQNPDWNVEFFPDRIEVVLTPTLTYIMPDETTVDLPMLPGFYSVFVRSVLNEQVINGELKQIVATSNEIGLAIAPRIVNQTFNGGNIDLNLDLGLNLLDENLPEESIQVIVAGEIYTRTTINPPAAEREFFIWRDLNNDPPLNLIRLAPHFPIVVSEPLAYPFRLIVNGAESAPFWIELNPP